MTLGRAGADTVTHIVSIVALLALGLGAPAVVGYFQHAPLDDIEIVALFAFETVTAVMMAYYSVQYQQTSTGVVITTTSGENSGPLVNPLAAVSPDGKTTVVIPAGYIIG